jgi:hypothetical protein
MFRFVLLSLVLLINCSRADFTSGCDAYEEGKYAEAKKEFTSLVDQGLSVELAFNLGCTEVKLGNAAAGVLWFNRALLLNPRHRESQQNLRYLKRREGVFVFDDSTYDDYARALRPASWKVAVWSCFWALVLGLVVLFSLRPKVVWPWIAAVSLAFLGLIATGIGSLVRARQVPASELSVVMKEDLSVLNAPADTADTLIAINAGSLVRLVEQRGAWSYVELPGSSGTRGWMKTATLEKLWPYALGLIE